MIKKIREKKQKRSSFTLLELLLAIVIIGILAAMGFPGYMKTKRNVLSREAIANLRLIAAAEKIYYLENNIYADCADTSSCNTRLKLFLNDRNWSYSVTTSNAGRNAAVTATGQIAGIEGCSYTLSSSDFDDSAKDYSTKSNCPSGCL